MADDSISLTVSGGVAHLEMSRPAQSNSFDLPTALIFAEKVRAIELDEAARVVLVSGAGKRFCAGGDVASMIAADDKSAYLHELAQVLDDALQRLASLVKPVVVAVQGAVAGAGIGVMLAGDIVVAASATKFVTAYASIGLTPDCGVSWLLPRAIGQQRALQLLLTPTTIASEQALAWGLITEVVDDDPVERAREIARSMAAGPAQALGQARRLVRSAWDVERVTSGRDESRTIASAATTAEATELLERFGQR